MFMWNTKPALRIVDEPNRSGSALTGIVSRAADSFARALDNPRFHELIADSDIRGLVEIGGEIRLADQQDHPGSMFLTQAPRVFDRLIVDETVAFLYSNWSRAFYTSLLSMVKIGGQLILPVWKGAPNKALGRWTVSDVGRHFRTDPIVLKGSDYVQITADGTEPAAVESVAAWFMENAHSVLLQHAFLTASESDVKPDYSSIFDQEDPTALAACGTSLLTKRMQRHLAQHCYYIGGIAYKAPLLAHIIRNHLTYASMLRYLDIGGGYGLLAAELALDGELNIAHAACADISNVNASLAARLYADFAKNLAGRFGFHCQPAEELAYHGEYDAISFVGSLLYVPKDQLRRTVEQAWTAIAPGGVLIVHENIKHPRFTNDYNIMFTVEEIDELLGQYGEIHRYASKLTQALSKEMAADKTVFRVVQKH